MMAKKESGFTLIEIVMVLVLLGILMAVAAPKYFDMQKEAKLKAADAVAAEVQARLYGSFAQQLLEGVACSEAVTKAISDANGVKAENWTIGTVSAPADDAANPVDVKITWGDVAKTAKIYVPICK